MGPKGQLPSHVCEKKDKIALLVPFLLNEAHPTPFSAIVLEAAKQEQGNLGQVPTVPCLGFLNWAIKLAAILRGCWENKPVM